MRRIWWEMEDRPQSKKPEEITYHHKEVLAPRLYESRGDPELAGTNPTRHKTPSPDGPTISNLVQYYLKRDQSGPWMHQGSTRKDKELAPRLCESRGDQEVAWTNPTCHKMPSSDGPMTSNLVQYYLKRDQSGPWMDQGSTRNDKIHAPRLWEYHRDQELARTNSICHQKPFSGVSRTCNSVQYHHNKDRSGLCHDSARDVKHLQIRMTRMEEEFQTSQIQPMLKKEELRRNHYETRLDEDDMYHLGSQVSREDKKNYVYIWQKKEDIMPQMANARLVIKRPEADTKNIQKKVRAEAKLEGIEVLESYERNLQKKWLERPIQKLRTVDSKAASQKGLKASMRIIQDPQETGLQGSKTNDQEVLQENPEQIRLEAQRLPRDNLRDGEFEASRENLRRGGYEESTQNVQEGLHAVRSSLSKKGHEPYEQKIQEWLEACIKNLPEECPEDSRKDLKEWLEISKHYLQEKEPEASKLSFKEWYKTSILKIQDLPETGFERSTQNVEEDHPEEPEQTSLEVLELPRDHLKKGWHEASIKHLPEKYPKTSNEDVKDWVENLQQKRFEVSESPMGHVKKGWLEASLENLRSSGSETSRQNAKDELQAVMSTHNTKEPEVLNQNLREWLEACIKSLQLPSNVDSPEVPPRSIPDQCSESRTNYEHLEISGQPKAARLVSSMSDLPVNVPGLQAPIPWVQRVQEWLEAACSEASKLSLQQWLEKSTETFDETSPGNSKLDLQKWLEGSLRNLQEPNAVQMSTGEWIRASLLTLKEEQLHLGMSAPQELHRPEGSQESLHVREQAESTIALRPSLEMTNVLHQSFESASGNVDEQDGSNPTKSSAASKENVGKQFEIPSDADSYEVSARSMLDWRSELGMDAEEHLEISGQPKAARLLCSIRDLQGEGPGLQASIPGVRKGASRLRVQEWLEFSLRSLEAAGAEASKESLQRWLEKSQRTLDETCPPNSRHDVHEWLQASLKNLQEPNAAKLSTEGWIRGSLMSLKEECPEVPLRDMVEFLQGSIQDLKEEASRLSVLEWLEASLRRLQEEDPESTRDDVKEWLESSHRKFRAVSPETSGHYIKKWLERSLRDLHTPQQNLQEYIKESLMCLRAAGFTATRSKHSWLTMPQSTIGARDSSGILEHGSSIAHLNRQDVSRTSLISKGNETDLDREEAPEISEVFITPEVHPKILKQRGSKGKGLLDRSVSNTKMLIDKVSSTFFQYRKPFAILLILIPIVLIAFAYGHYRCYCSSSGGLPPF